MKLSANYLNKFLNLCCQLSPENLTCDGELSRSEVNRRRDTLERQWKALEREVGHKVTENDVYKQEFEEGTKSDSNPKTADDVGGPDDSMDGDHASALASAGLGTDEDYGGGDERL